MKIIIRNYGRILKVSNELRKVDDIDLTFVYLNKKKYKEQELSKIFKSQHKNCISIRRK